MNLDGFGPSADGMISVASLFVGISDVLELNLKMGQ